ncbi:hypothetical protein MJO28_014220 [Puccinia striiformis f. sp. tritici]|uniref:Uncharacterized protein n=1 Tax=Puccinia striiformis f. sp. tritici TaxID=168172 RepID=A0ACC0DTJ5_9BASI|nr:hypothetical protein MJO28_014220 [Puccinia striiformis f. sp. tritici]
MIPIFCQSTITWIFTRTTKRQAAVFDSLALHFRQMIQKHTFSFVDQRDLIANKIRKSRDRVWKKGYQAKTKDENGEFINRYLTDI